MDKVDKVDMDGDVVVIAGRSTPGGLQYCCKWHLVVET